MRISVICFTILGLLGAVPLGATVVVSGQLSIPSPIPVSLAPGAFTSNSLFWLIPEVTSVVTPQDIPAGVLGGIIPAGTRVDAYVVHANPTKAGGVVFSGGATFDTQVVGLYVGSASLNATDAITQLFGSPIVTYPSSDPNRGLEIGPGCSPCDAYLLSGGNSTITYTWNTAGNGIDEARLLVISPVPEISPSLLIAAGLGAVALGRRRRSGRPSALTGNN